MVPLGVGIGDDSTCVSAERDDSFKNRNFMLQEIKFVKGEESLSLYCYGILRSENLWKHPRTGELVHLHAGIILHLKHPEASGFSSQSLRMSRDIRESFVLHNFY